MPSTTIERQAVSRPRLARSRVSERDVAAALFAQLDPEAFDPRRVLEVLDYFPVMRTDGQRVGSRDRRGIGEGRTFTLTVAPGVVSMTCRDVNRLERTVSRHLDGVVGWVRCEDDCTCDRDGVPTRPDVDGVAKHWSLGAVKASEGMARAYFASRRLVDVGLFAVPAGDVASRRITEWSKKSRARMVRAFGEYDWSTLLDPARPLGMITLTYPGDWLEVAPNGKAVKRHMRLLQLRYRRLFGEPLRGAWKLEFQERGAPHVHIVAPVPALAGGMIFERWLSLTWAAIVGADWCGRNCWDPTGEGRVLKGAACCERGRHTAAGTAVDFSETGKMTDPKRIAVYFLKHSAKNLDNKEYQNVVPAAWSGDGDGPGRFWGVWGMSKVLGGLELDVEDFVTARRVARKVMRARSKRVVAQRTFHRVMKESGGTRRCAEPSHGGSCWDRTEAREAARRAADRVPKRWTFGSSGAMTGGFLMVNDGPGFALDLSRALALRRGDWYGVRGADRPLP